MFDSSEEQLVAETQEIQEHIIISFNFLKTQGTPRTRALIVRQ
jgi:hypothetical protein